MGRSLVQRSPAECVSLSVIKYNNNSVHLSRRSSTGTRVRKRETYSKRFSLEFKRNGRLNVFFYL
jgi:hypothetical protein